MVVFLVLLFTLLDSKARNKLKGGVGIPLKPRQYELLEAMLSNPMLPDTVIAQQLGINNKTVGVWRKLPEFQEELKKRLADKWKDAERTAMETMLSLVRDGDFKAAKYVLDSQGYAPAQKIEASVSNDININIEE